MYCYYKYLYVHSILVVLGCEELPRQVGFCSPWIARVRTCQSVSDRLGPIIRERRWLSGDDEFRDGVRESFALNMLLKIEQASQDAKGNVWP